MRYIGWSLCVLERMCYSCVCARVCVRVCLGVPYVAALTCMLLQLE